MHCTHYVWVCLFCFIPLTLQAQQPEQPDAWRIWLEEYLSWMLTDGAMTEAAADEMRNLLEEAAINPRDLNQMDREALEFFPFLNAFQIHHLIKYRLDHGPITSLYDLKTITGWDAETIARFAPFVYVEAEYPVRRLFADFLRQGRSEVVGTWRKTLGPLVTQTFLGPAYATSLRWRHTYRDNLSVGFTAEKDAGEPFFDRYNRAYDAYTGHLMLRYPVKHLRTLVLGDYSVSMGLGLVLNQGFFGFGPSSWVTRNSPEVSALRPKQSTAEYGYMRGVGTQWSVHDGRLTAMLFYSHKPQDATVKADDNQTRVITSLGGSGLHRTAREWARKHAVTLTSLGGEVAYRTGGLRMGVEAVRHAWGNYLLAKPPGASDAPMLYGLHNHYNYGLFYRYRNYNSSFVTYGEVARSAQGGIALVQGVEWLHDFKGRYKLIARHITPAYWAIDARGMSHYAHPHNEQGLFVAIEPPQPLKKVTIGAYADWYRSLIPRYRRTTNTQVADLTAYMQWRINNATSLQLGYRHVQDKERMQRNQWRATLRLMPYKAPWALTMQALRQQLSLYDEGAYGPSVPAWMVAARADYTLAAPSVRLSMSVASFDVPGGWTSRLYVAVPRTAYDYPNSFVYGRGYLCRALVRTAIGRHLVASASWMYQTDNGIKPAQHQLFVSLRIKG